MRSHFIISSLILFPLSAFSQIDPATQNVFFKTPAVSKNTVVKTYSNENQNFKLDKRTRDFPTQIVRTTGDMKGQKINCDEVNERIEEALLEHITVEYFTYNAYITCTFDPQTEYAKQYTINLYFDPLSDEAIDYLVEYKNEYNGTDLMGTKLEIESAKGLVVAMNIEAGIKKNLNNPLFVQYQQDRSNFHFKSNYEMKNTLIADIYANFYSNESEKILPFLNRWIHSYAGWIYQPVLLDSDYVELQPERIFLMEKEGDIFVSLLKYYFGHVCSRHENHRCLKNG